MLLQHEKTSDRISNTIILRKVKGAGIVEGVIGVILIIGTTILAVLIMLNTGVATYEKEKIGFVADQSALYATTFINVPASQRDTQVDTFANQLLSDMGLNASNTQVVVKDVAAGGYAAVSVEVSADLPTLMSSAFSNFLPAKISVTDTGVAVKYPYTTAYGVIGSSIVCPLASPTGTPPTQLSTWSLSLTGIQPVQQQALPRLPSP